MLLRLISNACAVRATYSFLYVAHGLSQSLRFLPKGSQARGTRLTPASFPEILHSRTQALLATQAANKAWVRGWKFDGSDNLSNMQSCVESSVFV